MNATGLASVFAVPRGGRAVTRGGSGTAGRTGLGECEWSRGGVVVVNPLWREGGNFGAGEILVVEGTVDDGDDGVPTRFGAAKAIRREADGLVKCDVVENHSFPFEPPIGPIPLGNDEEGVSVVLTDFIQDAVEEGPEWVDVGVDEMSAMGKRVAS